MQKPTSKNPNLTQATKAFINSLTGGKPLYEMTPEDARKFLEDLQHKDYTEIEADVTDKEISTEAHEKISLRVYKPKNTNEKLPAILYIHGGGWILGGKESWDRFLRELAVCTNSAVIFPDYSRSPEAKFPKAINEIYSTLKYINENSAEFNIDTEKLVLAGDSAGANMATVTVLRTLKENGPRILFQLLFYPVTNADMNTESYNDFADGPWLTKKAMEWFWNAYEPDKEKRNNPYISPLKADEQDLKNMPHTLIITDENDVLRDEGEEYARKLDRAGVNVMNVRINGTCHDFIVLNALADTAPVKAAFLLTCAKLKYIFENTK